MSCVVQLAGMYSLVARMEAIKIGVAGMQAANAERLQNGEALAYDATAYDAAEIDIITIANRLGEIITSDDLPANITDVSTAVVAKLLDMLDDAWRNTFIDEY